MNIDEERYSRMNRRLNRHTYSVMDARNDKGNNFNNIYMYYHDTIGITVSFVASKLSVVVRSKHRANVRKTSSKLVSFIR